MNEVCFVPTKLSVRISLVLKIVLIADWAFFIILPLAFVVHDPTFLKDGLTISLTMVVMLLVGYLLFRKYQMKEATMVAFSPKGIRVTYKAAPYEEYAAWDDVTSVEFVEGDSESSDYYAICGTFCNRQGVKHKRRLDFEFGCWVSQDKCDFMDTVLVFNPYKDRVKPKS